MISPWFCCSEQHWSILASIDQHWSTLTSIVHHWITLINFDQRSSTSTLNNTDWYWSTLVNTDEHWSTPSTLTDIDQHLSNTDQHWSTLVIIDEHWLNMPSYPIPSRPFSMRASNVPQSPHRLLKAAEPLEAVISSRSLTQYKKFNFASKPKFVIQVWPFNTPHPSNPPVLQPSSHLGLGGRNARSDWIIIIRQLLLLLLQQQGG